MNFFPPKCYYWNTLFKWGGWVFGMNIVFIEFPVVQGLLEYFAFVKWLLGLQSWFLMVTWIAMMIFVWHLELEGYRWLISGSGVGNRKTNYELWAIQLLSAHVSSVLQWLLDAKLCRVLLAECVK